MPIVFCMRSILHTFFSSAINIRDSWEWVRGDQVWTSMKKLLFFKWHFIQCTVEGYCLTYNFCIINHWCCSTICNAANENSLSLSGETSLLRALFSDKQCFGHEICRLCEHNISFSWKYNRNKSKNTECFPYKYYYTI